MQALQARSPVSPISTITVESTFKRLAEQPSHLARRCRGTAAHFRARLCKRHHRLPGDPIGNAPISCASQLGPVRHRHQGLLVRSSQRVFSSGTFGPKLVRCRTPTTSPPPEEPLLPAAPATLGALLRLANMQQPKLTCHIYHKNISGRHQGNKRLLAELDLESMQAKRRTFPSFVGAWCNLSVEMVSMQSGTGANVSLPLQISNGRAPAPDYLPRLATLRTEQFSRRRVSGVHIPQTSVRLTVSCPSSLDSAQSSKL